MPESNLPMNVTRLRPPLEDQGTSDLRRLALTGRSDSGGARPSPDPEKEARRAEKRLRELSEPVEPWERYRALRQTLDEAQKFEDLADHKARFAMILMGALNALLLVLTLSESSGGASLASQPRIAGYLVLCGLAALYLFHQAIEALRPRSVARVWPGTANAETEPGPTGLRHHDDVLRRSHEAYLAAWRQVGVEQLNSEIALQVHKQAEVNRAKERALTRLYAGLRVMMLLLVGLVLILVTSSGAGVRPAASRGDGARDNKFYKLQPGHVPRLRDLSKVLGS